MKKNKTLVNMVSLGCPKNQIDSEVMLGILESKGYEIQTDVLKAEIIIINTCGFIESAKQESINTILEFAQLKERNCKILVVTGCLSERYKESLMAEIPEIDIMLGTSSFNEIVNAIESFLITKSKLSLFESADNLFKENYPRKISTGKSTAYLKIADGCDNHCSYCIIPQLRGSLRCRTFEGIIVEAKELAELGIQEIIIVAQDVMEYQDGAHNILDLIKALANITKIRWIRLLYCYPDKMTVEFIREISKISKLCHYFDIPIQHVCDSVLKKMNRLYKKTDIIVIYESIKKYIPDAVLRTSIITGFPGETQEDYLELKEFLIEYPFDWLGVFPYSREEGTAAAKMRNQVPESIRNKRAEEIMLMQKKNVNHLLALRLNTIADVLIESEQSENTFTYIGRSYAEAPNIDGSIFVFSKVRLEVGQYVSVKLVSKFDYDLVGEVYDERSK